jgi:lipopolysaccharide biosynthesis glycosyltransferase
MMHICFITDRSYLLPALTSITSLLINNSQHRFFLHIIAKNLSEKEKNLFYKIKTGNSEIEVIEPWCDFDEINAVHPYVTETSMYKFYLPEIFKDLTKILYLDVDILVQGDISSLFEMNIEDVYAATVKDMDATIKGQTDHLCLKNYFNSGMMLLNLKKMRDNDITTKLIEYKRKTSNDNFMDQNALNKIFNDEVIYLSPKYNYLKTIEHNTVESISEFFNITNEELKNISQKPLILHITGQRKPWNTCSAPCFNEFYKYVFSLPNSYIKRQAIINYMFLTIKYYIQKVMEMLFNLIITDNIYKNLLQMHIKKELLYIREDGISIKIFDKYCRLYRWRHK